jgi:hypothetical protein
MSFYRFSEFGWETIDHARPLFGGFWGLLTPKSQIFSLRPQKGTFFGGNASFEPSTMEIDQFTRLTCGGEQENNMKGKGYKPCIKSHKSVIFHVVVGTEPWRNLN